MKKTSGVFWFWNFAYFAMISSAAWSIHRGGNHGPSSWNTLIMLVGLTGLVLNWWDPVIASRKKAAKKILDLSKSIYSEKFEYRIASPDEFPELDQSFYEQIRAWFENNGFQFLGDRENVTLTRLAPARRTFIRSMISNDGTVLGCAYHVRIKARGFPADARIVEFETEFSDGTFLTTSNALETARTLPVPGIETSRHPAHTPPDALLQIHKAAFKRVLQNKVGITATQVETLQQFIDFQHRMHAVKTAHKQRIGFVNADDIRKVRGRELNEHEQGVADEIEKIKKRQAL